MFNIPFLFEKENIPICYLSICLCRPGKKSPWLCIKVLTLAALGGAVRVQESVVSDIFALGQWPGVTPVFRKEQSLRLVFVFKRSEQKTNRSSDGVLQGPFPLLGWTPLSGPWEAKVERSRKRSPGFLAPRVMQEMASSDRLCQALVFRNSHWSPTSPPSTLQISTVKDAFCTERGGDTWVCFQRCRSYLFVFVLFCDNQAENQSNGVLAVCTIFVLQI